MERFSLFCARPERANRRRRPGILECSSRCERRFCWGWDDQALYLAAEIYDEAVRAFAGSSAAEMGDRIELWLDVNLLDDFTSTAADADDFRFVFSPGNFSDVPARIELLAPSLAPEARAAILREVQARYRSEGSRYRGEIRIPWQVFGSALNLNEARLGAALSLVDSDADAPSQEHVLSTARALLSRPDDPAAWNNLDLRDTLSPTPTAEAAAQGGAAFISASFRHLLPDQHLMLYIDCRANYGEDAVPGIRADYLVQDGGLHYWSAEKGNKGWKWLGLVPFSNRDGLASWSVWHGWNSACATRISPGRLFFNGGPKLEPVLLQPGAGNQKPQRSSSYRSPSRFGDVLPPYAC